MKMEMRTVRKVLPGKKTFDQREDEGENLVAIWVEEMQGQSLKVLKEEGMVELGTRRGSQIM